MQENDSEFEKQKNRIFKTYHSNIDKIENLFKNKLITFEEKLESRQQLIDWREKEETLLKERFNKVRNKVHKNLKYFKK
jgi:hypothetical protein